MTTKPVNLLVSDVAEHLVGAARAVIHSILSPNRLEARDESKISFVDSLAIKKFDNGLRF